MTYPKDFTPSNVQFPATEQEIQEAINEALRSGNNFVQTTKNIAVFVVGHRVFVAHDYDYADIIRPEGVEMPNHKKQPTL